MWLKDPARRRRQRGTRAHLKGRRPSLPTEWGAHSQLGSEASSLCFDYWLLCTTRKAAPSPRHAWLLRSVLGGCVHPKWQPPPLQTGLGSSVTKASRILIPRPSESHLHPSVCEKEDKTKEPSVARLRESLQDDSLPTGGILLVPCLAGDAHGVLVLPCF